MDTMKNNETAPAQELLRDVIDRSHSGTEIQREAEKVAHNLREGNEEVRNYVQTVFAEQQGKPLVIDTQSVAEQLEEAGENVDEILGSIKTEKLEPGVAGQANQGMEGSSVINVHAALQEGDIQVIDTKMLKDVKYHEIEHENQAEEWNAEEVDIGQGETLTRHQVSEMGAMSVQSNIEWVSADYHDIYEYVASMTSAEQARETARSGDLVDLGRQIREEREVLDVPVSMGA